MVTGIGNVVEITEARFDELRAEMLEGATRTHSGYMKRGLYVGACHVGLTEDYRINNFHSHSDLNIPSLFKVTHKETGEVSHYVSVAY